MAKTYTIRWYQIALPIIIAIAATMIFRYYAPTRITVKAVHNACTNLWAVQLDTNFFGHRHYDRDDWRDMIRVSWPREVYETLQQRAERDTIRTAMLGDEFTFTDSLQALRVYNGWEAAILKRKQDDSVLKALNAEIERKYRLREDSIFKCKHKYQ